MLSPTVVHEIRRLLGQRKLSQRTIARQLGVSRGAVKAILLGKRAGATRGRDNQADAPLCVDSLERCPGCGGMVQMPCLLCRARWLRESRRRHRSGDTGAG